MDEQRARDAGTSSASSATDEYFPVLVTNFEANITMPPEFDRQDGYVGKKGIICGDWNSGNVHMLLVEHEDGSFLYYLPTELEEDHSADARAFWPKYLNSYRPKPCVWKYGWETLSTTMASA